MGLQAREVQAGNDAGGWETAAKEVAVDRIQEKRAVGRKDSEEWNLAVVQTRYHGICEGLGTWAQRLKVAQGMGAAAGRPT